MASPPPPSPQIPAAAPAASFLEPEAVGRGGAGRPGMLARALRGPGRSLEITTAGWIFIGLTLAVGFAAINSGSNLLHIVFGCQLGSIVASGILSERALRAVRVTRRPLGRVFAQTPGPLEVELALPPGQPTALALTVEDDPHARAPSGRCAGLFVLALRAKSPIRRTMTVTMAQRGWTRLPPAVVSTRFPFGLFAKRRELGPGPEILVLPRPEPANVEALAPEPLAASRLAPARRGRSGEFFGLVEHRAGEDLSRIHWPATARLGRLVCLEYDEERGRLLWIDVAPGRAGDPEFEQALSRATWLVLAGARAQLAVGLRAAGRVIVPPSLRPAALEHMLGWLAVAGLAPPEGAR